MRRRRRENNKIESSLWYNQPGKKGLFESL